MTDAAVIPALVRLDGPGDPQSAPIDPSRIVAGQPVGTVDHRYTSADGRFHAGLWSSTVGSWRVHYTEHEACVMLRGTVRLTADDGTTSTFTAGDAFVIPAGFSGCWETVVDCQKHYVIYEPA